MVYLRLHQRAVDSLEQAISLLPNEPIAQYHLGMAFVALKNKDAFWRQYTTVKSLEPDLANRLYAAFYHERLLIVGKKE